MSSRSAPAAFQLPLPGPELCPRTQRPASPWLPRQSPQDFSPGVKGGRANPVLPLGAVHRGYPSTPPPRTPPPMVEGCEHEGGGGQGPPCPGGASTAKASPVQRGQLKPPASLEMRTPDPSTLWGLPVLQHSCPRAQGGNA